MTIAYDNALAALKLATQAATNQTDITQDLVEAVVEKMALIDAEKEAAITAIQASVLFAPYNAERIYQTGEICTIVEDDQVIPMQMYAGPNLTCQGKDPADLTNRHDEWTDSSAPFWWIPYRGGRVGMPFFWLSEDAPEEAVMELNVDLPTAVYWRLAKQFPDLVTGGTINTGEIRGEFLRVLDQGRGVDADRTIGSWQMASHIVHDEDASATHTIGTANSALAHGLEVPHMGLSTEAIQCWAAATGSGNWFNSGLAISNRFRSSTRPRNVARPMAIYI